MSVLQRANSSGLRESPTQSATNRVAIELWRHYPVLRLALTTGRTQNPQAAQLRRCLPNRLRRCLPNRRLSLEPPKKSLVRVTWIAQRPSLNLLATRTTKPRRLSRYRGQRLRQATPSGPRDPLTA